ncbi:hypothetical protein WA026_012010 [Henosepilachna vigintioctopunctata]|uniref:Uncharacterized protein n=1 Tax=Henosepilachna vigintioctopunctata TaxID=420089 RepID=A0AAW1V4N6_9CUCU
MQQENDLLEEQHRETHPSEIQTRAAIVKDSLVISRITSGAPGNRAVFEAVKKPAGHQEMMDGERVAGMEWWRSWSNGGIWIYRLECVEVQLESVIVIEHPKISGSKDYDTSASERMAFMLIIIHAGS